MDAVAAAFADHLALCLRMSIDLPILRRERDLWKMDGAILTDNTLMEKFRTLWVQLKRQKGLFSDSTMWWD